MNAPSATDTFHWRACTTLAGIEFDRFTHITLDVFDTIVVRRTRSPRHVWLEVADRGHARGCLDRRVSREQFQALRQRVEGEVRKRAQREHGTVEVTFEEIWSAIPSVIGDTKALEALEFEAEMDCCVANPYFLSFMREARARAIPVTIVSDIYYGREQMRSLLRSSGVDDSLYESIYVSSERKGAKFEGKAFDVVLEQLGVTDRARVLHIGDNLLADYLQALRRGVTAVHHKTAHPSQDEVALDYMLGGAEREDPLASVRTLGRSHLSTRPPAGDAFFRAFGATVVGPSLVAFADWVVTSAAEAGVDLICPVMREGTTLSPLLERRIRERGVGIRVRPFFLSRASTFLPATPVLDARALNALARRRYYRLSDLVREFDLPEVPNDLAGLLSERLESILGTQSRADSPLRTFLDRPDCRHAVARASENARACLRDYASDLFGDARVVAFVDFGAAANSQRSLSAVLGDGRAMMTFLFYCSVDHLDTVAAGHPVWPFAGHTRDTEAIAKVIHRTPEFFETLLNGDAGTTLGYVRQDDGGVRARTATPSCDTDQRAAMDAFREGVTLAADAYAVLARGDRSALLSNKCVRAASLHALARVVMAPTREEAERLGTLVFEDNGATESRSPIFGGAGPGLVQRLGADGFLRLMRERPGFWELGIRWPQGELTRAFPSAIRGDLRSRTTDSESRLLCFDLVEAALARGLSSVVVYGGGKIGADLIEVADASGLRVEAVVDRNTALHGSLLGGVSIASLADAMRRPVPAFVVASAAFVDEIVEAIAGAYRAVDRAAPPILSRSTV
jgi:FMN phosphatase YigB (HAD superfamily)